MSDGRCVQVIPSQVLLQPLCGNSGLGENTEDPKNKNPMTNTSGGRVLTLSSALGVEGDHQSARLVAHDVPPAAGAS